MPRTQAVSVTARTGDDQLLRLVARITRGEHGAAVVAPPHPEYGGSIDNPVVSAIAQGLQRARMTTLAFNFRGVDGSEGRKTGDLVAAVEDFRAAFDTLRSSVGGERFFGAGYSFGAGTAVLHAREEARIEGLVLVAPPVGLLRSEDLAALSGPLLVIVGDEDEYAPLPALRELLGARPDCALEVIPGADHFFHYGGMTDIGNLITKHVAGWS